MGGVDLGEYHRGQARSSDQRLQDPPGRGQGHAGAVVGDGSYLPRLARAEKISSLADSYGLWNA